MATAILLCDLIPPPMISTVLLESNRLHQKHLFWCRELVARETDHCSDSVPVYTVTSCHSNSLCQDENLLLVQVRNRKRGYF